MVDELVNFFVALRCFVLASVERKGKGRREGKRKKKGRKERDIRKEKGKRYKLSGLKGLFRDWIALQRVGREFDGCGFHCVG